LLESAVYKWISPSIRALTEAVQLRKGWHSDVIDKMLYPTASDLGMSFPRS
jgi:hypothetical protein